MKFTATLLAAMAVISSSNAKADGFVCEGQQTGLNIKVYHNTNPNAGTRTPAIMIVSDPSIASDSKTIATFKNVNRTLSYEGYGEWTAKVDLRFNDSGRSGENIAGTKLGRLANLKLTVNFDYAHADAVAGKLVKGSMDYIKRDGEVLTEKVECARYLKN